MNMFGVPELIASLAVAVSVSWYVVVVALLFKIWRKVKHLPG